MNDFKYEVDDGKVTITDYTGAGGDVIVPAEIDGLPVTAIGDNAFCHCTGLTSITLPEGCTTIGYYAFSGCTGLNSITLPNSLTTISIGAFKRCTGLTSINIPAKEADDAAKKDDIAGEIVAILDLVHFHFGGLDSPISPESREEFRQRILKLKGRAE